MRIRRAFIRWRYLHGSMHLVTTTSPCHHFTVPPCRHVIRRPCHRATITPCHLPHHPTVPPATNMPQPCRRETWCASVTPPCHRGTWCATWCSTVTPPCHLVHHREPTVPPFHLEANRATWCATVQPCRRRTDTTHRHTSVHPSTWQRSIIPPYLLILSDGISPYGLLLKIAMTTLLCFRRKTIKFHINISQYCAIRKSKISHNEEVNGWGNYSCFR